MTRAVLARIGRLLIYPVGKIVVTLWKHSAALPRRVPSLRALTLYPKFRRLRRTAIGWLDEHFRLIEAHASWLEITGQEITDYCTTNLTTEPFSFPRDPPNVHCHRSLMRFYGADGDLQNLLAELAAALGAVGWGGLEGNTTRISDSSQWQSPVRSILWRPAPGFNVPAGLETMPPARQWPSWRWLRMEIDWVSGGRLTAGRRLLSLSGPEPARRRSSLYRQLERTAREKSADPVAEALSRHEHAIAIKIDFTYYDNANPNRPPGWMAKRLLPVFPGRRTH
jgi:hypothetical protein